MELLYNSYTCNLYTNAILLIYKFIYSLYTTLIEYRHFYCLFSKYSHYNDFIIYDVIQFM